jgi:hypothetical protein
MDKSVFDYLEFQFSNGRAMVLSGAGFSAAASDLDGKAFPVGKALAEELFALCFPGESYDGSSLQDLFHTASIKQKGKLESFLARRLSADSASLPAWYQAWFNMPWRRMYTLNVDDLESAVSRRFGLGRDVHPLSGILRFSPTANPIPESNKLEVVHLNGMMSDGIDGVTFSTTQYAERLSSQEPWYARLASDLLAYPFVFVGSPLDESILWAHIEHRGSRGRRGLSELRKRSFLVSPTLSKARQALLQEYNIEWLPMDAQQFATTYLANLGHTVSPGLRELGLNAFGGISGVASIQDVGTLLANDPKGNPLFLAGEEPSWGDLQTGRAVERAIDGELFSAADGLLKSRASKAAVLIVTGTAGSGKSTSTMRLALRLEAQGRNVFWIDRTVDASPRDIRKFSHEVGKKIVLAIDDSDRYGSELAAIVRDLVALDEVELVICAMRSPRIEKTLNPARMSGITRQELVMPHLTDEDIGSLLDALTRENRLGKLIGLPRNEQEKAFKTKCGRQLIIAMIEATSGQKFEDKISEEWRELSKEAQEMYSLIAVATYLHHSLSKQDLLLASGDQSNEALNAIEMLARRHIVSSSKSGELRARHRFIAEVLFGELRSNGILAKAYRQLAFLAASLISPQEQRGSRNWRFLKHLIGHTALLKNIGLDAARGVYALIEQQMVWDYHYWLQRGSLEVKEGDIRDAQAWLDAAMSINPDDHIVITEHAYMVLKRAIANPSAANARRSVDEASEILRDQIRARGSIDSYPFHILGSQAIAWSRKGGLARQENKLFLSAVVRDVERGLALHPKDLQDVARDLKRELLALEVHPATES